MVGPVGVVMVLMVVEVARVGMGRRGELHAAVGKSHVDLGAAYPAPVHSLNVDGHVGKTESRRERAQPLLGCPGREQSAEKHVATDAGDRVEDGKTAFRHRLKNIAPLWKVCNLTPDTATPPRC